MGCWLVVWGISLWNRHINRKRNALSSPSPSSLLAGGYEPIPRTENDPPSYDDVVDDDRDARERSSVAKPHVEDERIKLRGLNVLLLALPACCDITGTTLMNVGLLFVVASIYQMTRGALVLFVGLFSVLFLRRKLYLYQWLSLVCVVAGVAVVGVAGALFRDHHGPVEEAVPIVSRAVKEVHAAVESTEPAMVVAGVLLIAGAQIFTASQFVLEEWILENYAMDPLRVVGWEGIFGFVVTALGMVILHLAIGRTESGRYGYFDAAEGWANFTTNKQVALSSILIMISIGYVLFRFMLISYNLTNSLQWLQLLRSERHAGNLRHLPQHHRHLPHSLHLARLAGPRMGELQVAPSRRIRNACLRHVLVQRHRHSAPEGLSAPQ